jgi:23S rRNA pseudouridine2605 synthase
LRVQKYLSDIGYCSRRQAEKLMSDGRVGVNGRTAKPGDKVERDDAVFVDGKRVNRKVRREKVYLALYKPRGYVSAMSDPHAEKCVTELVATEKTRLYPVGRLDKLSEGLLLMTNDGEFSNLVSHPSSNIEKTYRVTVSPSLTQDNADRIAAGVRLDDGTVYPTSFRVTAERPGSTVFEISLTEGRNRVIRRICESLGFSVKRLKRTAIGNIELKNLKSGQYRELLPGEVAQMKKMAKG